MSEPEIIEKHCYSVSCEMNHKVYDDGYCQDGVYVSRFGDAVKVWVYVRHKRQEYVTVLSFIYDGQVYERTYERTFTRRGIMAKCSKLIEEVQKPKQQIFEPNKSERDYVPF